MSSESRCASGGWISLWIGRWDLDPQLPLTGLSLDYSREFAASKKDVRETRAFLVNGTMDMKINDITSIADLCEFITTMDDLPVKADEMMPIMYSISLHEYSIVE